MKYLLLATALLLASCATEQAALTTGPQLFAQATDSTRPAVGPLPAGGTYKFKGSVSLVPQAGTGNVATPTVTGTDKTGQHAQAVSTGLARRLRLARKKAACRGGYSRWWARLVLPLGSGSRTNSTR